MIQRWQSGDEFAFKEFYLLHTEGLLKIALRKVHLLHEAEEIVQDVFMGFYEMRDKIKDTPLAYLKTILRNKVYDFYHRKNHLSIMTMQDETDLASIGIPSLMEDILGKEMSNTLHQLINELPEQCRRVFVMSRNEALSNKEIAEKLGISLKAVEANITRALKYLREHLDYQMFWLVVWFWMK